MIATLLASRQAYEIACSGPPVNTGMPLVREIPSQQEFALHEKESIDARGMAIGVSSLELLDACTRLVDLLDAPKDIPFLGSLIQREIIYRLLRSPQGKHLRAIATPGEPSHRTAKAVEWLRVNYAKTLRVEELATMARMGVSTLHRQFRSLTTMRPLQFQNGATTVAGGDGSRQPTEIDLAGARHQGMLVAKTAAKIFG